MKVSTATERKSHFDGKADATAMWIYQGDFYVSSRPDLFLTTVLGSCIAVCMRDPVVRCGGMNHFLLPDNEHMSGPSSGIALRYGSYSIERLINAILSRGGKRERLEVKVFGGANMPGGTGLNIGGRNADFIEHYFARERIAIAASDLRGVAPRKIRYYPTTGRAQMSELPVVEAKEIGQSERTMQEKIAREKLSGPVEIF
jgi:chemotaxis protein CheD